MIVGGCSAPPENTGIFANPSVLEKEIRSKIGQFPARWEKLEFQHIKNNSISVWIHYPEKPELSDLELDTKRVAQAILDVVKSKGYNPKKNWFNANVTGNFHPPNRSDNRPHPLGSTMYNFNTDSFEFSKDWLY